MGTKRFDTERSEVENLVLAYVDNTVPPRLSSLGICFNSRVAKQNMQLINRCNSCHPIYVASPV